MRKKKFSISQFIATLVFIVSIFVFAYYNGKSRQKKLKEKGFDSVSIVERVKINAAKGTRGTKDLVYFFFVRNDTVFHKISDLNSGTIKRLKIGVNDAFLLRVFKDDYDINKVDYSVRIDTFIDKRKYKTQKYNTLIHKLHLE